MECPSCKKEVRIGSIYCHYCGEPLENIFRQQIQIPASTQDIPVGDAQVTPEVLGCDDCGRQDETLRFVTYPFVASIIFLTHRNAFGGLMCKKHQNLYLILASAITATVGWLGIPFGIIYAPVALFHLARGGIQPRDDNIKMLKLLARHKDSLGDTAGAIKCLEACLQFGENVDIEQELQQYRLKLFTTEEEVGLRSKIFSTIVLLFGAALIGATIGALDYVLTEIISLVVKGEVPIYLVILSWAPFVAMAFIGGIALYQLIEWVITRTYLRNSLVAAGLGGLAALVAAYSIAQGNMLGAYLHYLFVGAGFGSAVESIVSGVTIALIGGFQWIAMYLNDTSTGSIIYLVLMAIILAYYLGMAERSAIKIVQWQKRIAVKDRILFG